MLQIPEQLPGLRPFTLLVALYAVIWIPLEGDLTRVLLLGFSVTAVGLATAVERRWAGRRLSSTQIAGGTAVAGLLLGLGSSLLTLLFMALKTGLHAHGPEFTPAEIAWVWQQLPLWSVVGLLGGLGSGLLLAAAAQKQ